MNEASPHIERLSHWRDLLDLVSAFPDRYPFLLESVAHGTPQARFDVLLAFPGDALTLLADGTLGGDRAGDASEGFLAAFDRWWRESRQDVIAGDELPFAGGWFVYLGYELASEIEPVLQLPRGRADLPTACAVRIPAAIIRDHQTRETILVAEAGQGQLLDALRQDYLGVAPISVTTGAAVAVTVEEAAATPYLEAVEAIRNYIREGDVFQVNLSRPWQVELVDGVSAVDLYTRLRRHNPAPFAGLALFGDTQIISSSPERLVRVRGDVVETRPIAGTRPRLSKQNDGAMRAELLAHPKERAEHIMLIDLERNDLGRICRPGSVRVDELMVVESYAHVHHIVSNVAGQLEAGTTPGQVIRAVFPGGTITGCPKVRCMQIIAELEQEPRGAYTGTMGYVGKDGSMDLNILIRTMVKTGSRLSFRAGAGIVADSVAERELAETGAKARGLIAALK